ncbi:hypothetical protein [Nocardiopsis lambiniae]|uniref:Uncharacterized protein n=1 Tax=Nocardiopsis lambiniae TaxID=3075539 RepID=A0ABU2M6V7_9ACTN|nr:hypothetical protein [Nocardiopsis sp. DSM 44743]MDT0327875.1 hypothetical protein [Nocardiopsis sp. DSM 44743]
MDGVLPRAPTGRPRLAAVGAILILCLVGAPLMSLFPLGVWDVSRALTMSDAGLEMFLLTPVVTGVILLMVWLATRWLEGFGVDHALTCAVLVTGTAMTVPVVVAFLAPEATPLSGGVTVNIAFLTGAITTLGLGAAMVTAWLPGRHRPGALPALVLICALLAILPLLSEELRRYTAAEGSRDLLLEYGRPIAVLDHPDWTLAAAHRTHQGLRLTYHGADGSPLYVVTWNDAAVAEGIASGCEYPGVWCRDLDGTLIVHHSDGYPSELRVHLDDGSIVGLVPDTGTPADPTSTIHHLRPESPGEREVLAGGISSRSWR